MMQCSARETMVQILTSGQTHMTLLPFYLDTIVIYSIVTNFKYIFKDINVLECESLTDQVLDTGFPLKMGAGYGLMRYGCHHVEYRKPTVTLCGFTSGPLLRMHELCCALNGTTAFWNLGLVSGGCGEGGGLTSAGIG